MTTTNIDIDYFLNFIVEQSKTPARLFTVDIAMYLYELAGLTYDESRFTPRAMGNPRTFFVQIESSLANELITAARNRATTRPDHQLTDLEMLDAFEDAGAFSSSIKDVAARLNITPFQLESACKRARKERDRHKAFNDFLATQKPLRDYRLELFSPIIAPRKLVRPLKAANIETLGQLAEITERHFQAINRLGTKRLTDARFLLHHFELSFQPFSTETLINDRAVARYNLATMKSPTSTHDFAYEVATAFSTDCSEYAGATIELACAASSLTDNGNDADNSVVVLYLHKPKLVSLAIPIRFHHRGNLNLPRQLPDLNQWKELTANSLSTETDILATSFNEAWQIITLTCLFLRASAVKVSYGH